MEGIFILLGILFLAPGCWAQKRVFTRTLDKVARQVEASARPPVVKSSAAAIVRSERERGESVVWDMFEESFKPLPEKASREFVAANHRLQQEMLLNFVEKDAYLSLQKALVQKAVLFQLYDEGVPYGKLIDSSARVVLIGETHERKRVMQEVLAMLLDYKKAHPEKNVYYASEFIDNLTPLGKPLHILNVKEVSQAVRKRPFYRPYTEWIIHFGIPVIGLENPVVSAQALAEDYIHNSTSNAYRRWASPAGVEERNSYWSRILEEVLKQDPKAVVFVHAGLGHTNYNQPASLALKLRKYRPFVIEFNHAFGTNLNGLLESYAPFPPEIKRQRMQLMFKNQEKFLQLLAVRVLKDKRWALAAGCDMHILHQQDR